MADTQLLITLTPMLAETIARRAQENGFADVNAFVVDCVRHTLEFGTEFEDWFVSDALPGIDEAEADPGSLLSREQVEAALRADRLGWDKHAAE